MRLLFTALFVLSIPLAYGQLVLDNSMELTGTPANGYVEGLSSPTAPDAAITVEASLVGSATWATASAASNAITLAPTVHVENYRDGQLLRFVAPAAVQGPSTLACTGLPALPLVRPDGLEPARGQIRPGAVVEVIHAGSRWVLMNVPGRGCPGGTVAVSERLCVEQASTANTLYYPAAERCTGLGGRLCKWDEYYLACTQHAAELTGLQNWEWIDDTSNHAHSAVQVGAGTCIAQRSAHPNFTTLGRARCCFAPR